MTLIFEAAIIIMILHFQKVCHVDQVRLEPGCGATLAVAMERYANPPTFTVPWADATNKL
jgi:hypothetical protein